MNNEIYDIQIDRNTLRKMVLDKPERYEVYRQNPLFRKVIGSLINGMTLDSLIDVIIHMSTLQQETQDELIRYINQYGALKK